MSDQHNLPVSNQLQPTGRGQRVKKPSPKVRDATSPARSPSSPSTHLPQRKTSQKVPAPLSSADTAGNASQKNLTSMSSADTTVEASAASSLSSTPRTEQKIQPQASRHSSNKKPAGVTKTAKAPKKAKSNVMAPPKQPKRQELPPRTAPFSPATLVIYTWPPPHPPRSFLNLSESNRRWKNRKDEAERMTDFDDGADDWEGYDGDADLYDGPEGLASAIASSFVKRAKRAFWKGKSWAEFEEAEVEWDLKKAVEATDDELERRFREFEPLSNDLRLGVFDLIKERLCNEIWLEQYTAPRPSLTNGNTSRRDSRATT